MFMGMKIVLVEKHAYMRQSMKVFLAKVVPGALISDFEYLAQVSWEENGPELVLAIFNIDISRRDVAAAVASERPKRSSRRSTGCKCRLRFSW